MSDGNDPSNHDGRTVIKQPANKLTPVSDLTVISSRPATDPLPSAPDPSFSQTAAFPGNNPILAAAIPLLSLLVKPDHASAPFDKACADAISQAAYSMEQAGVEPAERTAALLVLCAMADDIAPLKSGIGRTAWKERSMTQSFFQKPPSPAGFFEMLNHLFVNPAGHYDLLQLMHTCLALGFQGQYRGAPQGGVGLRQLCDDLHATLCHMRPRPSRADPPEKTKLEQPARKGRALWTMAAVIAVITAGGFGFMHHMNSRDADAVVEALATLSPQGVVVIERGLRETPR